MSQRRYLPGCQKVLDRTSQQADRYREIDMPARCRRRSRTRATLLETTQSCCGALRLLHDDRRNDVYSTPIRARPGTSSLRSSIRFALRSVPRLVRPGDVAAGRARLCNIAGGDWIGNKCCHEDDGKVLRQLPCSSGRLVPTVMIASTLLSIGSATRHILAPIRATPPVCCRSRSRPSTLRLPTTPCQNARRRGRMAGFAGSTNMPIAASLAGCCARAVRPRDGPTAEQRDESRRRTFDHLVGEDEQLLRYGEADAFAVVRLIARSNSVGCRTGKSEGLAPLVFLQVRSPPPQVRRAWRIGD